MHFKKYLPAILVIVAALLALVGSPAAQSTVSFRMIATAYSSDGSLALTAHTSSEGGNMLNLWDVAAAKPVRAFGTQTEKTYAIAFSPDGGHFFSGGTDSAVRLWHLQTGKVLRTFAGHSQFVSAIAVSRSGKRVAAGSRDGAIRLWDTDSGQLLQTLTSHSRLVRSLAFSPDGLRIVSSADDYTIKLWNTETGALIHNHEGESWYTSVAFSPDGSQIASGGSIETCRPYFFCNSYFRNDAWASQAIHYTSTAEVQIWDGQTGELLRSFDRRPLQNGRSAIASVAFSPEGARLALGSKTLWIFDVARGQPLRGALAFDLSSAIEAVAFSADGKRILAASDDDVTIRDTETGELVATFGKAVLLPDSSSR